MDTLSTYRQIIENVLNEYAPIRYAHGDIHNEAVFDRQNDRYLIVSVGWDDRRVHGCLIHVDLIDGKIWIQRDGTEDGIAGDLEEAGIPKDRIVLGFKRPEIRKYTEYAVA